MLHVCCLRSLGCWILSSTPIVSSKGSSFFCLSKHQIFDLNQEAYQKSLDKIKNNRVKLDKIISILVDKQEVTGKELLNLLKK